MIEIHIGKLPLHPQFPHFIHADIHDHPFHEDLQAPDVQLFDNPAQHLIVLGGGRDDQGIGGFIGCDDHLPREFDPPFGFLGGLGLGGDLR